MKRALSVALFAVLPLCWRFARAANFTLVKDYSGKTFFDDWIFDQYAYDNTTGGSVNYVTKAESASLAYVNDANKVIIKVDNTSYVDYYDKRNSVRIATKQFFGIGSVFVVDADHLPFGCSVWPSIWTTGMSWPDNGEIDIIEGVNRMSANQMSLHAKAGCVAASNTDAINKPTVTDCNAPDNRGCTVMDNTPNSYGKGFADNGGGVWAMQFDVSGIYIWFWSRAHVPASIQTATDSVDISSWGPPSAAFPASSCDIPKYFGAQQIVVDITLCGVWAGDPAIYAAQCGGNASDPSTCNTRSVWYAGGSDLATAYFALNYIRAFSMSSNTPVDSSAAPRLPSSAAAGPSPSGSVGGGQAAATSDASAVLLTPRGLYGAAFLLGLFGWVLL